MWGRSLADPTPLPDARRAQALATIKQREDAIRANGIKQGRTLERREIMEALGAQTLEDASHVAAITAERDARPTQEAVTFAKRASHREGVVLGSVWGFVACLVVGALWMFIGAEMFGRNAATGSMIARQADNVDALEALDGQR